MARKRPSGIGRSARHGSSKRRTTNNPITNNQAGLVDNDPLAVPGDTNTIPPLSSRSNPSAAKKKAKQQKVVISLRNKIHYQRKSLDLKNTAIQDLNENVDDLKDETQMLALLEASAQLRAVELQASADKAYEVLTDRTTRFSTYCDKKEDQLKSQQKRAKKKVAEMEDRKTIAVAKVVSLSEMNVSFHSINLTMPQYFMLTFLLSLFVFPGI